MNPSTIPRVDQSSLDSTCSHPKIYALDPSESLTFPFGPFPPGAPYHVSPETAVLDTTTVWNLTANIDTVATRDGVEITDDFTEAHAIPNCQVLVGDDISLGDDFLKPEWAEPSNETNLMKSDHLPAQEVLHINNSLFPRILGMDGSECPASVSGQPNYISNLASRGGRTNRGSKVSCVRCAGYKKRCDYDGRSACTSCRTADEKAKISAHRERIVCVSSHIEDSNVFLIDAVMIPPLPPTLNVDALYAQTTSDERFDHIQTLLQQFHHLSSNLMHTMMTEPLYNFQNEELRQIGLQIVSSFNSLFKGKWYKRILPDLQPRTAELLEIFMQLAGTYRGLKDLQDETAFLAKHHHLKQYCHYIIDRVTRNRNKSTRGRAKDKSKAISKV